jgi:hypothetical protein
MGSFASCAEVGNLAATLVSEPCVRLSRLNGKNGYPYEHNRVAYHAVSKAKSEEYLLYMKNPSSTIDAALDVGKMENRSKVTGVAKMVLLCLALVNHFVAIVTTAVRHLRSQSTTSSHTRSQFHAMAQLYSLGNPTFHNHFQNAARNVTYLNAE